MMKAIKLKLYIQVQGKF